MQNFETGYYVGKRVSLEEPGTYEFYGRYHVEVVEPAADGTPRVRINGGRAKKVFAHSSGRSTYRGAGLIKVQPSAFAYSPDKTYVKRFPCDEVTISADPQFKLK